MSIIKVVQINAVSNGSTGKIMMSIHKELIKQKHESYVVWGTGRKNNNKNEICMEDKCGILFHKIYSHFLGKQGFASWNATIKLKKKLEQIKPDIVHLHNLHGNYINIEILFKYLKKNNIKTIWTFHDTWAFTGKCVHFSLAKCDKWKTECKECPIIHESPKSYIDKSNWCFKKKKEIFSNMDLTIVTPSKWLADLVKSSFLKNYNIKIINNGIDTNIFKKTNSNFRQEHNLQNKKMILGVASPWSKRKGLDDFIKLSKVLDDTYTIVLVGLSQKQIEKLPSNVIGITKTENQEELAGLYSTSDILFNPTYEDTYPTVNLEAISCGTPVLTYDTGGSPEFASFIDDDKNKYVIKKEDVKDNIIIIKKYIDKILNEKEKFLINDSNFINEEKMVNEYIKLYEDSKIVYGVIK